MTDSSWVEPTSGGRKLSVPAAVHCEPPPDKIEQIDALCRAGFYLKAHAEALAYGPLEMWTATEARLCASRLVRQLGAPRLSRRLALRAYRSAPHDPEALFFYVHELLEARGPLAVWTRLRDTSVPQDAEPKIRTRLIQVRARAAIVLRDFDAAAALLDQAEAIHERDASMMADRAALLAKEDRYEAALAASREGLRIEPLHHTCVHHTAHLLALLGRNEEAILLLDDAGRRNENASFPLHQATLQVELRRYEAAMKNLDRYAALSPLLEDEPRDRLHCQRSDCAYYLGDMAAAIDLAKTSSSPFYQRIAARLASEHDGKQIMLDVGFVRQHHLTCAPATLATVSRFWGKVADHLEVAEAICYDGTPAHSQRKWAEQNGWKARELTITWKSAVALLDQGIPFTLSTIGPVAGHLQAVIGYDERRGTLYIRDPFVHVLIEAVADLFLEGHRSSGPRGMVLVPVERASMLSDIDLPDAGLYDALYRQQRTLSEHDRDAAEREARRLSQEAPDHRLALISRRLLAAYDGNTTQILADTEALLALYPKDATLEIEALRCMSELASRKERIERIEAICARGKVDPVFYEQLAGELAEDAREHPRAARLLRRVLRTSFDRAEPYRKLAGILWDACQFAEALEIFRFAACIEPVNEACARSYFFAACMQNRSDEAIQFLLRRQERLGARSGNPMTTLFDALEVLDRTVEAFACLDRALALRPEDGELLLFAADAHSRYGRIEQAQAFLSAAEGRAHQAACLRMGARLAEVEGKHAESLRLWRQILDEDPLAIDVHRAVASRLSLTEGREAAHAHLAAACAKFPHHRPLLHLRIAMSDGEDPKVLEAAIRQLLALEPAGAWTHRQLALVLAEQRRFDEAFEACDLAAQIDSSHAGEKVVRARLATLAGKNDVARQALRDAIRLYADCAPAITELAALATTQQERNLELSFIEQEVFDKSVTGEGIAAWFAAARRVKPPEAVLPLLESLRASREHLFTGWSVSVQYLCGLGRLEAALPLAQEATRRFPLRVQAWLDLADVSMFRKAFEEETHALTRALAIAPDNTRATLCLSVAHSRAGRNDLARGVLERAVARTPLDPVLLRALADSFWLAGQREAAIERQKQSMTLDRDHAGAWNVLHRWCSEVGKPQAALEFASGRAEKAPWDASAWLRVAQMQEASGELEDALATVERALSIQKLLAEGHTMRATLLAKLGRKDDAIAACTPLDYPPPVPLELRAHLAELYAMFNEIPEAIAQLRKLVKERPDYLWGWVKLADMYHATNAHEEALAAALELVRIEPTNSICYGYTGEAKALLGDRKGAMRAYRRALELDPQYRFAAAGLLTLELDEGRINAAKKTLETFSPHADAGFLAVWKIRIAVRQQKASVAAKVFREFAFTPDRPPDDVEQAGRVLIDGAPHTACELFRDLVDEPNTPPEIGPLWVRAETQIGRFPSTTRLRTLATRGEESAVHTICVAIDAVAPLPHATFWLFWLIIRLYRFLRSHTATWGYAGFGLAKLGWHLLAAIWLANYRREDAHPWMLHNLRVSLDAWGRTERIVDVTQFSLDLPPDHTTPDHLARMAYEDAVRGFTQSAQEAIARLSEAKLDDHSRNFVHLTRGMIEAQTAARGSDVVYERVREHLGRVAPTHFAGVFRLNATGRAYSRAARRIGHDVGTAKGLLWGYLDWTCVILSCPVILVMSGGAMRGFQICLGILGLFALRESVRAWLARL